VTSIVIAAHNEAAVIGRCLDTLLAGAEPDEFDVTVVANGCTDATATLAAARPGIRVLDLPDPGKARALNAGDVLAEGFPRVYLDADIVVSAEGVRALRDALTPGGGQEPSPVLAATSRRELDLSHSPLLVRAYYAINSRLPAFQNALFGRGVVALSAGGRARFGRFPDIVADDLFLDSLFSPAEKREVESVSSRIAAPRRTSDLVRRLARVRRGNAALRTQGPRANEPTGAQAADSRPGAREPAGPAVRGAARTSWLRDVALRNPALLPAAACYAGITLLAAALARLPAQRTGTWGRDDSSRAVDQQQGTAEALDGRR
jgi:glycosyltransferase involved in cell wall biosynthesis